MESFHEWIAIAALGIEALAVTLITGAFLFASIRFIAHTGRHASNAYQRYKTFLGRTLLLGLEFLVAADVIRTVAVEPSLQNIGVLGALVVVRTFLSWSLVVEMEGRWPSRAESGGHSE